MYRISHIVLRVFIYSLCLVMLQSCGGKQFNVEANLSGLGTQNVRVIYWTGEELKSIWLPAVDNKFSFQGLAENPTVVGIYNQHKTLITRFIVENGDNISINGNVNDPDKIKVNGNEISEEWSNFIIKNYDAFKSGNSTATNLEIEKYIRNNPRNLLSTLLLIFNYSDISDVAQTEKLLALIDEKAKPQYLIALFNGLAAEDIDEKSSTQLTSFNLYSGKDSIEGFNPSSSRVSILYFWLKDISGREESMTRLRDLYKQYPKGKLQIADITLENDSSIWKSTIKKDSVAWKQFWGLGGRMNSAIVGMNIPGAPFFIVTDSIGTPLYRGRSGDEAYKAVVGKLDKKK